MLSSNQKVISVVSVSHQMKYESSSEVWVIEWSMSHKVFSKNNSIPYVASTGGWWVIKWSMSDWVKYESSCKISVIKVSMNHQSNFEFLHGVQENLLRFRNTSAKVYQYQSDRVAVTSDWVPIWHPTSQQHSQKIRPFYLMTWRSYLDGEVLESHHEFRGY